MVDLEPVLQGWVDPHWGHSPFLVGATQKTLGILWVNFPEAALPRLVFLPRNFDEALVERQVVADGVLKKTSRRSLAPS